VVLPEIFRGAPWAAGRIRMAQQRMDFTAINGFY
jgi:hypothetical protein